VARVLEHTSRAAAYQCFEQIHNNMYIQVLRANFFFIITVLLYMKHMYKTVRSDLYWSINFQRRIPGVWSEISCLALSLCVTVSISIYRSIIHSMKTQIEIYLRS
jgi:hypothetical protein